MESALTYVRFPKVTAPGAVMIVEGREVVRTIKDPLFGEFKILKSVTGRKPFWETDPSKVEKLIDAFKAGHNIKNACIYAGVSTEGWRHFNNTYPQFGQVREACEAVLSFSALKTVGEAIPKDSGLAYKYAKDRGDFNFKPKVDDDKPLQPTIVVPVQINNNIDHEKIKDDARRIASSVISKPSQGGEGGGAHRVENTVQG